MGVERKPLFMSDNGYLEEMPTVDSRMRYGIDLLGPKDGVNKVFTTPEEFSSGTIRVYFDGVRMREAVDSDYVASESGGPGSGYDTVTFVAAAPRADENMLADYMIPSL